MTVSVQEKKGWFYAVIYYKDGNKPVTKWRATGVKVDGSKAAEKEAEKKANVLLAEYEASGFHKASDVLFADYMLDWLETSPLAETTYTSYDSYINKHLYPYFSQTKVKLIKLSPDDVEDYMAAKEGQIGRNTLRAHVILIQGILSAAMTDKRIRLKYNICQNVKKGKKKKNKQPHYKAAQLKLLFEVIMTAKVKQAKGSQTQDCLRYESMLIPVYLASHLGLCRSEVLGVKYSNIEYNDDGTGMLYVCNKVVRTLRKNAEGKRKLGVAESEEMKTETRTRKIPLCVNIATTLKTFEAIRDRYRLEAGDAYCDKYLDYLCVNRLGERLKPDYISDRFDDIIKQQELDKVTFHGLRHSFATLGIKLKTNLKDLQGLTGHAQLHTLVDIYGNDDDDNKMVAMQNISEAIGVEIQINTEQHDDVAEK